MKRVSYVHLSVLKLKKKCKFDGRRFCSSFLSKIFRILLHIFDNYGNWYKQRSEGTA